MITRKDGFTLLEVIIAMAIIAIVSLGTIDYQFHAIRQAKIANTKIAATRLGTLILENWKSFGGNDTYDPTTSGFDIVKLTSFENETKYSVTVDDIPFYLTLSSNDIDSNSTTGVILRELSISIQWNSTYQEGLPQDSDPKTTLYTYVRQDQSGG